MNQYAAWVTLAGLMLWISLVLFLPSIFENRHSNLWMISLVAISWSMVVLGVMNWRRVQRVLSFPLLVHCGKLTYGMYAYHYSCIYLSTRWTGFQYGQASLKEWLIEGLIALLLTYAFARLSWKILEHPAISMRRRFTQIGPDWTTSVMAHAAHMADLAKAARLAKSDPGHPFPASSSGTCLKPLRSAPDALVKIDLRLESKNVERLVNAGHTNGDVRGQRRIKEDFRLGLQHAADGLRKSQNGDDGTGVADVEALTDRTGLLDAAHETVHKIVNITPGANLISVSSNECGWPHWRGRVMKPWMAPSGLAGLVTLYGRTVTTGMPYCLW